MPVNYPKLPHQNAKLLETALTHRSFLNENKQVGDHNERLEFLGDAVLELSVSEFLYHRYPDSPEGDLTAYRAALVRTTSLADAAKRLGLGEQLRLSKGEQASGGSTNPSLLANTFESVLGALYLDLGLDAVKSFLEIHLFPEIETVIQKKLFKDYKSSLQEHVQSLGHDSPTYLVLEEQGPDHNKEFKVAVLVNNVQTGEGWGRSKQAAQQSAAKSALEKLTTA